MRSRPAPLFLLVIIFQIRLTLFYKLFSETKHQLTLNISNEFCKYFQRIRYLNILNELNINFKPL